MKKERVEYLVQEFPNINRKVVFCALSVYLPKTEKDPECECEYPISWEVVKSNDYYDDYVNELVKNNNYVCEVVKAIKFGYSICNLDDEFNEEVGKKIALGRAKTNKLYAMLSTEIGDINTDLATVFLKRRARYFSNDNSLLDKWYKR